MAGLHNAPAAHKVQVLKDHSVLGMSSQYVHFTLAFQLPMTIKVVAVSVVMATCNKSSINSVLSCRS